MLNYLLVTIFSLIIFIFLVTLHWSEWTYKSQTICEKSCEQEMVYERHCIDMSKENKTCLGKSKMVYKQPCTGENCGELILRFDLSDTKHRLCLRDLWQWDRQLLLWKHQAG